MSSFCLIFEDSTWSLTQVTFFIWIMLFIANFSSKIVSSWPRILCRCSSDKSLASRGKHWTLIFLDLSLSQQFQFLLIDHLLICCDHFLWLNCLLILFCWISSATIYLCCGIERGVCVAVSLLLSHFVLCYNYYHCTWWGILLGHEYGITLGCSKKRHSVLTLLLVYIFSEKIKLYQ